MKSILTVLTRADDYDLTTLDTLKEELGITDNSQDKKLSRWITESSAMIGDFLNRVLALEEVEEVFRQELYAPTPSWDTALPLSRFPVTQIESITSSDGTLLDPSAYVLDADPGLLYRAVDAPWWDYCGYWGAGITVRYWAGYELVEGLPRAIEAACLTTLRYRSSSTTSSGKARDPNIRMERVYDLQEIQYFDRTASVNANDYGLPSEVTAMLRPYRREIP